ncbi:hypothetical protein [Vibrio diabolicus]|uniref:hypothetical protein n=1 Tax=Vibrio diabolicus TaxID=50719 RepID=UPI00215F3E2D|nr:hypothetical protein [Vibrio diabolicus]MCS0445073.1 hypothetical protein [Vibrio diabolicus]
MYNTSGNYSSRAVVGNGSTKCVLAAAALALFSSSAGAIDQKSVFQDSFIAERSGAAISHLSSLEPIESNQELSVKDMVETIVSNFGLAIKDYETIFGVKRATIYNWKKGSQPSDDAQFEKIKNVYQLALDVSPILEHRLGRQGKTHLYNGTSVVSKIASLRKDELIDHCRVLNKLLSAQLEVANSHPSTSSEDRVILPGEVV